MALEHRGFKVNVEVAADEQGMQWICRSSIEPVSGAHVPNAPTGDELAIPRLKIDPLLAIKTLEHAAVNEIDSFYAQQHVGA